jgi:hypothetical protein
MPFSSWKEDSLYSSSKSVFWHCTHRMSNTNVERICLFGTSRVGYRLSAGFPIFFGIHCIDASVWFENTFHTGSQYDVTVNTTSLSFPWDKFLTKTRQKQGNQKRFVLPLSSKKLQEQADRLPPPRTLILDFTMTHTRYGRSHVYSIGQLTNTRSSDGAPELMVL